MTPSNIASSSPTNWFLLVQTVGIVAGLMFSGWALYLMVRTTRVTNLLQLTQFHRQIWNMVIERPDLREALRHDFSPTTITDEQRLFIRFLVLHLSASFIATRAGALFEQEGLATDVATFFSAGSSGCLGGTETLPHFSICVLCGSGGHSSAGRTTWAATTAVDDGRWNNLKPQH